MFQRRLSVSVGEVGFTIFAVWSELRNEVGACFADLG